MTLTAIPGSGNSHRKADPLPVTADTGNPRRKADPLPVMSAYAGISLSADGVDR